MVLKEDHNFEKPPQKKSDTPNPPFFLARKVDFHLLVLAKFTPSMFCHQKKRNSQCPHVLHARLELGPQQKIYVCLVSGKQRDPPPKKRQGANAVFVVTSIYPGFILCTCYPCPTCTWSLLLTLKKWVHGRPWTPIILGNDQPLLKGPIRETPRGRKRSSGSTAINGNQQAVHVFFPRPTSFVSPAWVLGSNQKHARPPPPRAREEVEGDLQVFFQEDDLRRNTPHSVFSEIPQEPFWSLLFEW